MAGEIICKACIHGPCKLGDIARYCLSDNLPASVVTVQDMVNHISVESLKVKK